MTIAPPRVTITMSTGKVPWSIHNFNYCKLRPIHTMWIIPINSHQLESHWIALRFECGFKQSTFKGSFNVMDFAMLWIVVGNAITCSRSRTMHATFGKQRCLQRDNRKTEQVGYNKVFFNLHKEPCDEFTILRLINKRLIYSAFFILIKLFKDIPIVASHMSIFVWQLAFTPSKANKPTHATAYLQHWSRNYKNNHFTQRNLHIGSPIT